MGARSPSEGDRRSSNVGWRRRVDASVIKSSPGEPNSSSSSSLPSPRARAARRRTRPLTPAHAPSPPTAFELCPPFVPPLCPPLFAPLFTPLFAPLFRPLFAPLFAPLLSPLSPVIDASLPERGVATSRACRSRSSGRCGSQRPCSAIKCFSPTATATARRRPGTRFGFIQGCWGAAASRGWERRFSPSAGRLASAAQGCRCQLLKPHCQCHCH